MRNVRAATLLLLTVAAGCALVRLVPQPASGTPGVEPVAGLVVAAASWVATGAAAYLLLCTAVIAVRQLRAGDAGRPVQAPAGTPTWLRRLVALALGGTVIAATVGA